VCCPAATISWLGMLHGGLSCHSCGHCYAVGVVGARYPAVGGFVVWADGLFGFAVPAAGPLEAVRHMLSGLQALGWVRVLCVLSGPGSVVSPVPGAVLVPGPWCADAPLWGNVFAPAPVAPAAGP
jgi:hypothetical protein